MTTLTISSDHHWDKKFLLILLSLNILVFTTTILVYSISTRTLQQERQKIFYQTADRIEQMVEERMLAHVNVLRGLQAFWARNPEGITSSKFDLYLTSINLFNDYPSISSVNFIKKSGEKLITTYISPIEGREAALSFNSAADPDRKKIYDAAADGGQITLARLPALVTTKQPGIILLSPLYLGGQAPQSLPERREQLLGFVVMVFRETELFKAIFGRQNPFPDIDFHIYHNDIIAPDQLIYDYDETYTAPSKIALQTTMRVTVGNTPWTIIISAKPSFSLNKAEEKLPLIILSTGLIFSISFGFINLFFYRRHLKTWH